jgi:hypothetical protein
MERTLRIIGNISALIGIGVFIYPVLSTTDLTFSTTQLTFLCLSILIFVLYLIYEFFFNAPKKYKNDQDIKKFMQNWIAKAGRTVIFTRDMSWVDNDEIKDELRAKARKHELLICLPQFTAFTHELHNLGAEIYEYPNIAFTPKSRFTFINYGTPYSKVAIGRKDEKHNHFIEEYSIKNTVEYFLAEDLVNLVKAL